MGFERQCWSGLAAVGSRFRLVRDVKLGELSSGRCLVTAQGGSARAFRAHTP